MSLTKAQQKAYQKMKEQKNAKPAGTSAEGKAKSKADSEAHICQVDTFKDHGLPRGARVGPCLISPCIPGLYHLHGDTSTGLDPIP